MKALFFVFFTSVLFSTTNVRADDSVAIKGLIGEIDAAARKDKARMLRILIINTDVGGPTLEKEKSQTGFSFGEVYVAHSIALAAHKSFNQVAASKAAGLSWGKVAQVHQVSLRGSAAAIKEMMRKKKE